MNTKHMFESAKECCKKSDYEGSTNIKIGCVVAYKGTILAKGWNTNKTHTIQHHFNQYRFNNKVTNRYLPDKCHAEINALRKIKYLDIDFSNVHVYVYREYKDGASAMARPCAACMRMIKSMGIKYIHYTTADGMAHEVLEK